MRTIGIIAEYNPFHSGHRHHIQAVRQAFGADCAVVCAMSGNWVQRGRPPWRQVDPDCPGPPAGGGPGGGTAHPLGGVLGGTLRPRRGGPAHRHRGGGHPELWQRSRGAAPLCRPQRTAWPPPAWQEVLRQGLAEGLSFPVARQQAATALLGDAARCLQGPNNNLGVEYLLALRALESPLRPHTVPRQGAGHDEGPSPSSPHASASYLRERILAGDPAPSPHTSPPQRRPPCGRIPPRWTLGFGGCWPGCGP